MYEKLKQFRKTKKITCVEMAFILGLTKATYSKKEKGIVKFSLSEAKKIADFLGTKIDDIFFDDEVSKIETIRMK